MLTIQIYNKIDKNINCIFIKFQENGMELSRNSILSENLVDSERKRDCSALKKKEGRKRIYGSTQLFAPVGFHKGNYR